jgi:hypothetical protein
MAKAKRAAKTINAKRASRPKSGSRATSAKTSAVINRAAKTTNALSSSTSAAAMAVIIQPPLAPEISWEDAVAEGKRLVAEGKRLVVMADKNDWRLTALAHQVVKKYGENKLSKFASEIGISHCAVKRRRTTYRNWEEILKGDPGLLFSLSYSVARALETHPDRERLIKANPQMTKREAVRLMKAYRDPESEMRETQRLWKNLLLRAGKAITDENFLNLDRQILLGVVEPTMLSTLRDAGEALIRLADGLENYSNPRTKSHSTALLPDGPAQAEQHRLLGRDVEHDGRVPSPQPGLCQLLCGKRRWYATGVPGRSALP